MNRNFTCRRLGVVTAFVILCSSAAIRAQEADADREQVQGGEVTTASSSEADRSEQAPARPVDQDSGEVVERPAPDFFSLLQDRRQRYTVEGPAYTMRGKFLKAHGPFLIDYERYVPDIALWGGGQMSTGLSGQQGEFSLWEVGVVSHGRVISGTDTFLNWGGLFTARDYDFDAETGIPDMRLYTAFADMGIGHFLGDDLMVDVHFQPGLATDFGGTITSDQWKWFGEALATFRAADWLYLKLGVRADETLEDTPVYPMAGLSCVIGADWQLDILAPRYAELSWTLSRVITLRGCLSLRGMEYGYHATTGTVGTENDLKARTQELRAYLDGVFHLDDHSSFFARVGSTFAGDYDFERPAGGGNYAGEIESALFFAIYFGSSF